MTFLARRLIYRFTAALLLAIAGLRGAIPVADAIAGHQGAPERLGIHLDKPGGCSSHAEHCVLRGGDSGIRFAPSDTTRAVAFVRVIHLGRVARDRFAGRQASTSNHSRAPPVTSV